MMGNPTTTPPRPAGIGAAPETSQSSGLDGNGAAASRLTPRSPRAALQPDRIPEPKRASKRARHPVVVVGSALFTIVLLLAAVGAFVLAAGKQRFDAPGPLETSKIVNIPHGLGLREIADLLQREGVIDQPWVFVGGVLALKARNDLKYGEYEFRHQASLRDVVETIVQGKVYQHQLTIPEGLTSEQIVERLMQDDVLSGNIKDVPKEGSILPDGYKFARGTTREQLITHMQQAQHRVLQEIWDHRSPDLPLKGPEQLVVLASIVEKETGKADERSRVAAVFVNRLKGRMRLQSDPTIIYGLVGGKGTLGHPITRSEIDQPTPYNTYVIDGLPPGPIANPGRASLEAAANPARTKELYFVADGTGGHAFSETLDQHQKNVARLRQIEQQQRGEPPDPVVAQPAGQKPAASTAPNAAPSVRSNGTRAARQPRHTPDPEPTVDPARPRAQ
jgi:UPF0755 protein